MRGARIHGATHLEGVRERVQDGGDLEHPTRGGLYVYVWGLSGTSLSKQKESEGRELRRDVSDGFAARATLRAVFIAVVHPCMVRVEGDCEIAFAPKARRKRVDGEDAGRHHGDFLPTFCWPLQLSAANVEHISIRLWVWRA